MNYRIHKLIAELANLTTEGSCCLGYLLQVKAYCSYSVKQAFSFHDDIHEIQLQIDSENQWYVFVDTFEILDFNKYYQVSQLGNEKIS